MPKRPNDMRRSQLRSALPFAVALLCAPLWSGCRDAADPSAREAFLAVAPTFKGGTSGLVDVDQARFTVRDPETEAIVLQTTVQIDDGASTVDVELIVPLGDATTAVFFLTMELLDAQGIVVFVGSATVMAFPADEVPQPVPIELTYVGPGADAVAVQIVPPTTEVLFGDVTIMGMNDEALFTAIAFDDQQTALPGTPAAWRSLNSLVGSFPDLADGRITTGEVGTTLIVAELLTGQADTATVLVGVVEDDPSGDSFEGTASTGLVPPDILRFGGSVDGTFLIIGMEFVDPVASALSGSANTVVGFIDIDVDQDPQTGVGAQTDFFRPQEDPSRTGLGVEYFVSLTGADDLDQVPLIDAATGLEVFRIAAAFVGNRIVLPIPLAILNDDGNVSIATVAGTSPEPTDIAPNNGAVTVFAPSGAPPAGLRADTEPTGHPGRLGRRWAVRSWR